MPHDFVDLDIHLEYIGDPVVSPSGKKYKSGEPYLFGFSKFFVPVDWTVFWFRYDDSTDPRPNFAAFKEMIKSWPIKEEQTRKLAYAWHGAIGKGKNAPADRFATLATGSFEVPRASTQSRSPATTACTCGSTRTSSSITGPGTSRRPTSLI